MERPQYILYFLIFTFNCICFIPSNAQTEYGRQIYNAYINGNMPGWSSVITEIESKNYNSVDRKLELLNYYYGYTGYLIGTKDYDKAQVYISKGEKLIDEVLKSSSKNSTAYAYKGSFTGFNIAMNKLKSVYLGPESMKYINTAYELDTENIQAVIDRGNMLYYTPGIFGGDKKEAVKMFEKGISLMESSNKAANNWFYLNALVTLAQYYEELGQKNKALYTYRKILSHEPDFKWVRDELYPKLKSKM